MASSQKNRNAWPVIISEWLVNLSAGWFAALAIELKLILPLDSIKVLRLTAKLLLVILSLISAKKLRLET